MKAVVFDMDGVIIDSEYSYFEATRRVLKEEGIEKFEMEDFIDSIGKTDHAAWSVLVEKYNLQTPMQEMIDRMKEYQKKVVKRDGFLPIDGVKDYIRSLSEQGFKLAVASSSPKDTIERVTSSLGIQQYFDALVSGEEVEKSKPAPDVYLEAARQLDVDPKECIAIEDAYNGLLAAKDAGMYAVAYESGDYPGIDLSPGDEIIQSMTEAPHFK